MTPTDRPATFWRDRATVAEAAFHTATDRANRTVIVSDPADPYVHDYVMQQYSHRIAEAEIHRAAAQHYRMVQADAERAERRHRYDSGAA